jgi:4'-phosphopantetheinyl transferase
MTDVMHAYRLEQTEADVPAENQWLSTGEMSCLAGLRFAKRRADWRLGRWTAKQAVASCLNLPLDLHSLQDVEIRAASSGAPEVFLFNQGSTVSLAISHRAGQAFCVVGLSGTSLGCDLELIEPRDHSFAADFFTANEQKLVERASEDERQLLVTLLWSAKESGLKALHVGLRVDTTLLDVSPAHADLERFDNSHQDDWLGWSPLVLRRIGGKILSGWWRCAGNMVRTVVFNPWG